MSRAGLILVLLLHALAAHAQPRIGVLAFSQITEPVKKGLSSALREVGYTDGKTILVEWRGADGNPQQAKAYAKELVRLKVSAIIAVGTPAVQAARDATSIIPIVMAPAGDPMRFVSSLSRPGGNVTGVAGFGGDLAGKRIELFRELFPGIKRIGLLTNTADPFSTLFIAESRTAAAKMGVELVLADAKRRD